MVKSATKTHTNHHVRDLDVDAYGREILRQQANALRSVAERPDASFAAAVEAIASCEGTVVLSGLGKSWLVAQKISATMASTGTSSIIVHPVDALHGDLGRLRSGDVLLTLSNSGASVEVVRLVRHARSRGVCSLALTRADDTPLARESDISMALGVLPEVDLWNKVPTSSTTAMLAWGDALALAAARLRGFTLEDFARLHPAGALGRRVQKVRDLMRSIERTPVVGPEQPLAEALECITAKRCGAAYVTDAKGRLVGIFTDGDLRRLLIVHGGACLSALVCEHMHPEPHTIAVDASVEAALEILRRFQIDELPVVDRDGVLLGHVDVQDLMF